VTAVRVEYASTNSQLTRCGCADRRRRQGATVERILRKPDAAESSYLGGSRLIDTLLRRQTTMKAHTEAGELLQGAHPLLDLTRPRPRITGREMSVDHAPLSVLLPEDHGRA